MSVRALAAAVLVALALAPVGHAAGRGKHLYGRYCLQCHGANGLGIDHDAKRAGPPLRGVGALAADFYLRTGYMPLRDATAQPRRSRVLFSEGEIRALVAYVASLGPARPVPKPHPERGSLSEGQQLFADHCAGCHQIVAAGGYLTGAVAPPLTNATSVQVAEAIRIGPYVMPRFSTRQLSPHQVDSIVRYVRFAQRPDDRGGWAIGHLGPVPEGLVTWFVAAAALVGFCLVVGRRLRSE
ncbi:MAG: ubiquinol-cytochrome c reductase cytochrome c subunit [Gaiellaceae bacterium]|jgi:ubiquinol-cytochrome c reductase cytochrome c subunit|nr:ubiquinol-cytochrome c reductase cytochrome c subunit [Gaiellaceae bacterium]